MTGRQEQSNISDMPLYIFDYTADMDAAVRHHIPAHTTYETMLYELAYLEFPGVNYDLGITDHPLIPLSRYLSHRFTERHLPPACDQYDQISKYLIVKAEIRHDFGQYVISRLWHEKRCVYQPDNDFAEELLNTSQMVFDIDYVSLLPYSTFYIDLENVSSFQGIAGVFVSVYHNDTLNDNVVCMMPVKSLLPGTWNVHSAAIDFFTPGGTGKTEITLKGKELDCMQIQQVPITAQGVLQIYGRPEQSTEDRQTWEAYRKGWRCVSYTDVQMKEYWKKCDENHLNYLITGFVGNVNLTKLRIFVYQFITFLCAENADIQKHPHSRGRGKSSQKVRKADLCEWDVGKRYGDIIRTYKKAQAANSSDTEYHREGGTHASPRPHTRRAHWTTVLYGKGKQLRRPQWILECFVGNKDAITTTAHFVTDKQWTGSSGETLIRQYLDGKHIKYKTEYVIPSGKRFDFRIQFGKQVAFIEFDGEQHFKPVDQFGGNETYADRVLSDKQKNQFCKDNGISLLRIRYDQAGSIPSMIADLLKNPSKYRKQLNTYLPNETYYSIREPVMQKAG